MEFFSCAGWDGNFGGEMIPTHMCGDFARTGSEFETAWEPYQASLKTRVMASAARSQSDSSSAS